MPTFDTNCPNVVINLGPGACYGSLFWPPSASDNCGLDTITYCFVSGEPADIGQLPIGEYDLIAKAKDIYGNVQTCTFHVSVIEFEVTNGTIVCNDLVNISLDQNCQAVLNADMILEGNIYRCYENYCIKVETVDGLPHDNLFTLADENQTFKVSIIDCNGGQNICWGYVHVEQKLIPVVSCPRDTLVYCGDDTSPENLGFAELLSCETKHRIFHEDRWLNGGICGNPRNIIYRDWFIDDYQGNIVKCTQEITVAAIPLDEIDWPVDIEIDEALDCNEVVLNPSLTDPEHTGYPSIYGLPVIVKESLDKLPFNLI